MFTQPKPPARSHALLMTAYYSDDGSCMVDITGDGEIVLSPRYPALDTAMRAIAEALRPYDDDPRTTLEDVALTLYGRM